MGIRTRFALGEACVVLLVALALTGCGSATAPEPAESNASAVVATYEGSPIRLELSTRVTTYAWGDSVPMTFTVTNLDVRPITLYLANWADFCYFTADDAAQQEVWRFPQYTLPVGGTVTLNPGGTRKAWTVWPTGELADGGPGVYTLNAEVHSRPQPSPSSVSLRVVLDSSS